MLRVANRTRGQDLIVGCKKGESGGQGSGRTVNAVKFSKPKGNLVISNCPAWTVVIGLSLIQWGFSETFSRKILFIKRNDSTLHWWQCRALIRHTADTGSGRGSEAGHLLGVLMPPYSVMGTHGLQQPSRSFIWWPLCPESPGKIVFYLHFLPWL